MNPLHDQPDENTNPSRDKAGYVLPRKDYTVVPLDRKPNPAADLIRDKITKLYATEPDALEEERQAEVVKPRSKHQEFIHNLNHSGKDLVQVQTEWHSYYMSLDDADKHAVWQEFYDSNQATQKNPLQLPADTPTDAEKIASMRSQLGSHSPTTKRAREDTRDPKAIQQNIRRRVAKQPMSRAKQHLHSLLFGLSMGGVVVVIFLFGFFNEVIIAPFIQPARTSAATPLIVSTDTVAPSSEPQVIIPKINVQIPLQFGATSIQEEDIQNDLESGVVHYPTTANPGQNGNSAYFGHSSNNIFNKGKYKFAFVLLHELVPGDTFYLTKEGKIYAYKVFSKTVVEPNEVGVLNPVAGHPATATLITCDPPGTSLKRLVVVGDQISPSPDANAAATTVDAVANTGTLTGNGPTLWGRFVGSGEGKIVVSLLVVGGVIVIFRRTSRSKSN
jgi:LPXTG-site transpeptidase (sortase) family protein